MNKELLTTLSHLLSSERSKGSLDYVKKVFSIFAHHPDKFIRERTYHYLFKLIKTQADIKTKEFDNCRRREFFMKFLSVKFYDTVFRRRVLGIVLKFNFLSDYEKFDYEHLLEALKKVLPGIHILEDSFYIRNDHKENNVFCYFEIEKIRGKVLNFQDCLKLKREFALAIKDSIEYLSPDLFFPVNEEDIFINVSRLNKEISVPEDIPHVIINFCEQDFQSVKFNVILLRTLKSREPMISSLLYDLNLNVDFQIEDTSSIDFHNNRETSVFTIELNNSLFSRKNRRVDLLRARQYVCLMLETAIGEFRDFNGGLLSKQTEHFKLIDQTLTEHFTNISDFEELYYSLRPTNIQLLLTPNMALDLCTKFYQLKNEPIRDEKYVMFTSQSNEIFMILIKTESDSFDSIFTSIPLNSLTSSTSIMIDHQKYHCLIQINPPDLSLLEYIQEKLLQLEKDPKIPQKKELNIPFEDFPPSIHPHLSTGIRNITVCKALFEGLTRVTKENVAKLALAQWVRTKPCKKIYTFVLNPSKWSNGEEVTAFHFVDSWKKAILDQSGCIRRKNFFIIKNAKKAHQGLVSIDEVGIKAPSKYRLIIELEYPVDYFLELLADPIFSPLYNAKSNVEPEVFNGPFIIKSNKSEKQIELIANPLYWDVESVKLDKINIVKIPDPNMAYEMYNSGQLDWTGEPFNRIPENIIECEKDIKSYDSNFPFWLFCNTNKKKLKSTKIRKALSLAINREKLIQSILPSQKPSYSIIPKKFSYLDLGGSFSVKHLEKARMLFEEGLSEIKCKKDNYVLNIGHYSSSEQKSVAYFLKDTWEKAFGININITEDSWNSYWNAIFNQDFDIAGFFLCATYESFDHFSEFFESSFSNFSNWEDKKYQELISQAKVQSHQCDKDFLLRQSEMILNSRMPVIPLYESKFFYLVNRMVRNLVLPKFGYFDFKWVDF